MAIGYTLSYQRSFLSLGPHSGSTDEVSIARHPDGEEEGPSQTSRQFTSLTSESLGQGRKALGDNN